MAFRPTSIRGRVRAIILAASGAVLLASFVAFILLDIANFRAQVAQHLDALAAVIADNCAAPLAFHNKQNAQDILSALRLEPDIAVVVLYDAHGEAFATFPPVLATNLIPKAPQSAEQRFERNGFVLSRPIFQESKQIGLLYLRSSLGALYVRLGRYAAIASVIFAASIAAAAILSAFLGRRISNPVLALTDIARTVARTEDYSLRAPKIAGDEVGVLADAFNRMLVQTQEHQARLAEQARLLDLSFDAIIVLNASRRITYWSRGAVEIYGYSRYEAIGAGIDDLLKTVFPEPRADILQKFHRQNRWVGELRHTRKDGATIVVSTRWALDRDEKGGPGATLETNSDITERKRTEEALGQAQAELRAHAQQLELTVAERTAKLRETIGELEAFSYSISHDMRAPLRAMTVYAKAMMEDFAAQLPAGCKGYLDNIISGATRMDQLITDVLAYSRVARDQRHLEPVNVESLLDEVISHFPELQAPNADIQIHRPLPVVIGDRPSLGQCISNLLTNAVKFVAPAIKPVVRIRAEQVQQPSDFPAPGGTGFAEMAKTVSEASVSTLTDPLTHSLTSSPAPPAPHSMVRLWFEDNGIGIAENDLGRIFGMFERVHPREHFEGTGIGLAIVKKAVERMGGHVGVLSTPGKGSRFWLELKQAE